MSNLKANRKRSNGEELVKHTTSEFTELDEATCSNILDKIVNENKLIRKKYAEKDKCSLPSTNNKTESDKKNLDIADFQAEIMALKELALSKACLLKKEAKALSANVSVGNSNSLDSPNAMANELLIEKLEKENSFLREDFRNKVVIIKTLIENITIWIKK